MIAVVQRVSQASVTVEAERYEASIGPGLCVLLCAESGDGELQSRWIAGKLANLRIFRDDQDKMNRSVLDIGGEILAVSQFTLAGDASKGHRPSFIGAASPEEGRRWFDRVCELLRTEHGLSVQTGIFGAMMKVGLVNDGPVTIIIRKST
jgi:D-aminoacyl-tRNA deacylase